MNHNQLADRSSSQANVATADIEKTSVENPQGNRIANLFRAVSNASTVEPSPPRDGGPQAWFQVFLVHLTIINTWGLVNSFGVSDICPKANFPFCRMMIRCRHDNDEHLEALLGEEWC